MSNPITSFDRARVRGFTLTRPWPWAFVNGSIPKRIENRSWKPPASLCVTHHIALHAAKSYEEGDRAFIADTTGLSVPPKSDHPSSIIFAVCRVVGYVESVKDRRFALPAFKGQETWFFGRFGWLIQDFVELDEPVPCKGALGLWGFAGKKVELAALHYAYACSVERQNNERT